MIKGDGWASAEVAAKSTLMTLAGDLCFSAILFGGYAWGLLGNRELAITRSSR